MIFNSDTSFIGHYGQTQLVDVLKEKLSNCDEFMFSVSFIKESGLSLIKNDLESALDSGVKGSIITCDYLDITEVDSLNYLKRLSDKYPNFSAYFIEVSSTAEYKSFHTKGYIFKKENEASIIIGSSNLSATAITSSGGEWSLISNTITANQLYSDVVNEFNTNINKVCKELDDKVIDSYSKKIPNIDYGTVAPNFMQEEALKELIITRKKGINKALIVAAMGSGKTLLSAFDTKAFGANHILYVCQTDMILRKAKIEFEKVYGNSKTYGFYFDKEKNTTSDIIFATNKSLANHLDAFDKNYFDYIIMDEAHHTPATTFLTIMKYYSCSFLLGMTGTPDRLDQKSVRVLFADTIPYELSLKDAIKYDLIMPFKYYSVSDRFLDYSNNTSETTIVNNMVDIDHCLFVKSEIDKHKKEINGKLKCLAFCVNIEHAERMAKEMSNTSIGYNTAFITGSTSGEDRQKIYNRLQDENDPLQIVFSINVLNEGVDLPSVNMALFLRPTESTTIFIQQLGRALRKDKGKMKPIIIDFIGKKYERCTYIAWALGALADAPVLTKPIIKDVLNGKSSVSSVLGVDIILDDQSKTEIDGYVDNYNFNKLEVLRNSYNAYKSHFNMATFPRQTDFITSSAGFDLMRIINVHKSYYNFLQRINEFNVPKFSKDEKEFLDYLSSFLPLTRPYEYKIISVLINEGPSSKEKIKDIVRNSVKEYNDVCFEHAMKVLLGKCSKEKTDGNGTEIVKKTYVVDIHNLIQLAYRIEDMEVTNRSSFIELDFNSAQFRKFIIDTLEYGLMRFEEEYENSGNDFELYKTYSRKEYTRIVNNNYVYSFQPGVIYPSDNRHVALFIDMIKKKNVEEHLNYGDRFITNELFEWESQTDTVLGNPRYNRLVSYSEAEIFVRKYQTEDGVNLPYVYLGKGKLSNPRKTENEKKTLLFDVKLNNKLPQNLFEQFNIQTTSK